MTCRRVGKTTWNLQILSYSSMLRLHQAAVTTLRMRITWEESTCFCIVYSSKSTFRQMMYKYVSWPERTPIEYTSNHSSATDPRLKPRNLRQHCITRTRPATLITLTRSTLKAAERNYGFQKRASLVERGATVAMIGRIHSLIFFKDRYMLNEVNVKVRLVRNKDSFCLMSGEANPSYKV